MTDLTTRLNALEKSTPAQSLKELIEKRKAAEPNEWILGGCSGRMITTPSGYYGDGFLADFDTAANAEFAVDAAEFFRTQAPALLAEIERYRKALENVAEWKLPESGVYYPNEDGTISDRPAPYDSFFANGTNGGISYIRSIARAALNPPNAEDV